MVLSVLPAVAAALQVQLALRRPLQVLLLAGMVAFLLAEKAALRDPPVVVMVACWPLLLVEQPLQVHLIVEGAACREAPPAGQGFGGPI